jgi:hypothetical protein
MKRNGKKNKKNNRKKNGKKNGEKNRKKDGKKDEKMGRRIGSRNLQVMNTSYSRLSDLSYPDVNCLTIPRPANPSPFP